MTPKLHRRRLVEMGRRLVVADLGHEATDEVLAQQHQEMFLPGLRGCAPHTWFKTVAQRAIHGRDPAHRRITNAKRQRRMLIGLGDHDIHWLDGSGRPARH